MFSLCCCRSLSFALSLCLSLFLSVSFSFSLTLSRFSLCVSLCPDLSLHLPLSRYVCMTKRDGKRERRREREREWNRKRERLRWRLGRHNEGWAGWQMVKGTLHLHTYFFPHSLFPDKRFKNSAKSVSKTVHQAETMSHVVSCCSLDMSVFTHSLIRLFQISVDMLFAYCDY